MPVFAGQLSDQDVDALIVYIKSLSASAKPEELADGKKTYNELKTAKDKK